MRDLYEDQFTADVVSIEPDGTEPVFDCSVAEVHRFDANGIIAHNCGEIALHVTGGYCVIADFAPLLACPVPVAEVYPGLADEDVAAMWDARVEDSVRLAVRFLIRANRMNALYGREVSRTNRIGVGPTGLHEWAWVRFGLTFDDLLNDERVVGVLVRAGVPLACREGGGSPPTAPNSRWPIRRR